MTNPTSNFGWQMPQSTDLVTDLPADFEVFGQAVDTDFVDLLGGTTGQVLSKTSATDLDFTWINNDTGDITGVTAGTGITGGGTSGTVTVTNDMATTITAAGDIVVGTGSGTYDNLPIGTTAQVLTADTTVSPYKVKWATPAGGAYSIIQSGALSTTSVDITGIPGTYKHLQLVMWNTTFAANDGFALQINGLTASNYARSSYGQNGATSVDGSVINDNGVYYGNGAADPLYTSGFNHWVLDIYDYTNTTGAWAMRGNGTYLNTSSVYSTYQAAYTYVAATATAITRVNIKTGGSRTMAGNYILYGVN
jgi:hypothetical protein